MLTLAMPQSEPVAETNSSASAWSLGEDARREALRDGVVQRDRLVEGVVGQHVQHRREGLRPHDLALVGHAHDGRLGVVGVRRRVGEPAATADEHLPAGLRGGRERVLHRGPGPLADQRAHQGALGQRVPDREPAVGLDQPRDEVVDHRGVRDHPAQGGAALAGRAGRGEHDAAHGEVEVGRRRHDGGVVAAELEQAAAEARGDPRADLAAHPGRAGGRDQRDVVVVDQPLPHVGRAEDDLPEVLGGADVARGPVEQGGAAEGGQRRGLGRLPHHGVAAHQRDRGVPRPDRHREVEGADHADDAQRVPGLVQPVTRSLRRHRAPVELARQADREVADVDHLLHLAQRLGADLARLQAHQVGQVGLVLGEQLAEPLHQRPAHRRRHRAPPLEGGRGPRRPPRRPAPGCARRSRPVPCR